MDNVKCFMCLKLINNEILGIDGECCEWCDNEICEDCYDKDNYGYTYGWLCPECIKRI